MSMCYTSSSHQQYAAFDLEMLSPSGAGDSTNHRPQHQEAAESGPRQPPHHLLASSVLGTPTRSRSIIEVIDSALELLVVDDEDEEEELLSNSHDDDRL